MKMDEQNNNQVLAHATYLTRFTVVVFGDSGVGKSSIIRLFVGEEYMSEHKPTVEEFYVKQVLFKNKPIELQIIDTSGSYEFPVMRKIAIQKADAAVLVYSLDKTESFTKLERYMKEIEMCREDKERKIPVVVVSNKSDLPNLSEPTFLDDRGLKVSSGFHLEAKWKCKWLPASAKFKLNVDKVFESVLETLCPEKKKVQRKRSKLWSETS